MFRAPLWSGNKNQKPKNTDTHIKTKKSDPRRRQANNQKTIFLKKHKHALFARRRVFVNFLPMIFLDNNNHRNV